MTGTEDRRLAFWSFDGTRLGFLHQRLRSGRLGEQGILGKVAAFDHDRDVGIQLLLDTNAINSRQADKDLNQLERWNEDGVITLVMSETSQDEARADGHPARVRKALGQIASTTHCDTKEEQAILRQIETIIFPDGATTQNKKNDVDILFNAWKYGGHLVTNDGASKRQPGGILGNAEALNKFGIRVMRPSEAVGFVAGRIRIRDQNARLRAERYGTTLPEWVGKDDPT